MLMKKPKREDYPSSQDGSTAWLMDDRNHHKARAKFAITALESIKSLNHPASVIAEQVLSKLKYNE